VATPAPFIIPLFIAHEGCPQRCSFCNQHVITGGREKVTAVTVEAEIEKWLIRPRRRDRPVQVAFYGGSFTALARERQAELLAAVRPFLAGGRVTAIRLSTRPDCVERETAEFLRASGVTTVELGVQSMSHDVLARSGRGYHAGLVQEAVHHLRHAGLIVGCQLMLGLPGETTRSQLAGLRQLLALEPDFLRFYPALILEGSRLAALYRLGRYRPLTLRKAVILVARMKAICDGAGVKVVRMGLQPSPDLEREVVAGPYHPAFGELVLARMMFAEVRRKLTEANTSETRTLTIAAADESIFRGPGNCSRRRLEKLGLLAGTLVAYRDGQQRQTVEVS
jgi:histone acetyltransferase (RNA polymerase elongator complex component)